MQRAAPFRPSVWRLGLMILACYALVMQVLLAAPSAAARSGIDAPGMTALCLDTAAPAHGSPLQPPHQSGDCCAYHCGGGAPVLPVAAAFCAVESPARAPVAVLPAGQTYRAASWALMPARGPPAGLFASV